MKHYLCLFGINRPGLRSSQSRHGRRHHLKQPTRQSRDTDLLGLMVPSLQARATHFGECSAGGRTLEELVADINHALAAPLPQAQAAWSDESRDNGPGLEQFEAICTD